MNAVIASHSYSPPTYSMVKPAFSNHLAASGQPAADMQRPVRMRNPSLAELTAVLTYSDNAATVYNPSTPKLDVYA